MWPISTSFCWISFLFFWWLSIRSYSIYLLIKICSALSPQKRCSLCDTVFIGNLHRQKHIQYNLLIKKLQPSQTISTKRSMDLLIKIILALTTFRNYDFDCWILARILSEYKSKYLHRILARGTVDGNKVVKKY